MLPATYTNQGFAHSCQTTSGAHRCTWTHTPKHIIYVGDNTSCLGHLVGDNTFSLTHIIGGNTLSHAHIVEKKNTHCTLLPFFTRPPPPGNFEIHLNYEPTAWVPSSRTKCQPQMCEINGDMSEQANTYKPKLLYSI